MALLVGVDEYSLFTDRSGFSFRVQWRPGATLYHHDNYGGDELWVVFTEHYGTLAVGYDHESDLNHFDRCHLSGFIRFYLLHQIKHHRLL